MGLGDMNFRNQTSSASPDGKPGRWESHRRAPKLSALTLMLVGGVLLLGAVTGRAKDKTPTTRTVTGVVFDDAENTIEGATIELTDIQTGKVLDIYSQKEGQYQFTDLRFDHDYKIKATFKNSSSEVRRISMFETRWHLVLNLTIPKANK
jgi:hypothetical protein